MTDANELDPNGEKVAELPEPFRYTASNPIPESPRGKLARAGQQIPKDLKPEEQPERTHYSVIEPPAESVHGKLTQPGQQIPKSDKAEEQPERTHYSVIEPPTESVHGKLAQPGQQIPMGGKAEEEPEPTHYSIIEPPAQSLRGKLAQSGQQIPKGGKTEEQPEPLHYSIIEPPPEIPRGKLAQPGGKNPKVEKTEEEPEPLRYAIVEPAPEIPGGKVAQAGQQDPKGEKTEEQPEPVHYAIVEPPPPPPDFLAQAILPDPLNASADAKEKTPAPPPAAKTPVAGSQKSDPSRTRLYIGIGAVAGLGLIFGLVIALVSSRMGGPEELHDWGSVTSDSTGLKGHLFTQLGSKLEYRLALQPSDPNRQAGFAFAVAHSPRPLAIEIHLRDAQGFVVCSRNILLKYDPASAPALSASNPASQAGPADAANAAVNPPAHAVEELLAAQEAERELGKEVFKNDIGPDGQIAAIDAQGELPCLDKAYASAFSWSFAPDFPSLAEQDALLKGQSVAQASVGQPSAETPAPRRKAPRISAPPLLSFTIEGDDAIVEFDPSRGIIETRAGKTFLFNKASGEIANPKWQDYPVGIHYKCDQASACTITHSGAGALRVRLTR
jgi:hypothetical protein